MLLLLQSLTVNGEPVSGFGPFSKLQQRAELMGDLAFAWVILVAVVQLMGAFAIYQAASRAEASDRSRPLIFSPPIWGLVALVVGPLGLLAVAGLLWWLGYASYTEVSEGRSPARARLGSEHEERVARLQAELDELRRGASDGSGPS